MTWSASYSRSKTWNTAKKAKKFVCNRSKGMRLVFWSKGIGLQQEQRVFTLLAVWKTGANRPQRLITTRAVNFHSDHPKISILRPSPLVCNLQGEKQRFRVEWPSIWRKTRLFLCYAVFLGFVCFLEQTHKPLALFAVKSKANWSSTVRFALLTGAVTTVSKPEQRFCFVCSDYLLANVQVIIFFFNTPCT